MTRPLLLSLLLAGPLGAQQPPVGIIDVYGARTLAAEDLRVAAGINVGDTVGAEAEQLMRSRLLTLPNVVDADVAIVCCENGQLIVYLGVQEREDAGLTFGRVPTGDALLPVNVVQMEQRFMQALQEAAQRGEVEEDDSLGHALMRYAPARAVQEEFSLYALGNVAVLRDVLRSSANAQHRALAAQIIAYSVNKYAIIPDLLAALQDPEPAVRNNALRALGVLAHYAQRNPAAMVRIPGQPMVALLNSPVWTDRNKAAFALLALTADRDPMLLLELRRNALPALIDMLSWQNNGHALPAAFLLGRLGGLPDDAIMTTFQTNRNALIEAARSPI